MLETVIFWIVMIIVVLVWLKDSSKKASAAKFEKDVQAHMGNLLKGGLIPKAPKAVHNEALRRIACDQPNVQLPKAKYFETSSSYDTYEY